jgi:hypothetical protein
VFGHIASRDGKPEPELFLSTRGRGVSRLLMTKGDSRRRRLRLDFGKRTRIWITNLVRRTDRFVAHYLFPISCNVARCSELQVCRKAKSTWGRGSDLLPRPRSILASKIPASRLKRLSHASQDSRTGQRPEKIWMVSRPAKRFAPRV